jgi:hypothetical protein
MPPEVDRPPAGIAAPPLATALLPPVLEGGRLEEEPLEVEGLEPLEEPEPAGRMLGVELAGLMPLPGGRGRALATAEPGVGLVVLVGVGTRDIAVLGYGKLCVAENRSLLGSGYWETHWLYISLSKVHLCSLLGVQGG